MSKRVGVIDTIDVDVCLTNPRKAYNTRKFIKKSMKKDDRYEEDDFSYNAMKNIQKQYSRNKKNIA